MKIEEITSGCDETMIKDMSEKAESAIRLLQKMDEVWPEAAKGGQNLKLLFMAVYRDGMVDALNQIKRK